MMDDNNTITLQSPPPSPPRLLFVIPYRDRLDQLKEWLHHMTTVILKHRDDYEVAIMHQHDTRPFNRGAMKNFGFLYCQWKYPTAYKRITIVFNDVDTFPLHPSSMTFDTIPSVVKHFYGYIHLLGGIVSMTGGDFEAVNGFPCYWAWGYEDNMLQTRVAAKSLTIDRSQFYKIGDKEHVHQNTSEGATRTVNRGEFARYVNRANEGIRSLHNVSWSMEEGYEGYPNVVMVNLFWFETGHIPEMHLYQEYDLRQGSIPFFSARRPGWKIV